MSERQWAAIVYGRSYNLDFRFVAVPQDFTQKEIAWASKYIFATTRQARKLSASPRWSMFKNQSHCVVGVTCMVRDLIESLDADLTTIPTRDNRGRPLYIFVGYVTQLDNPHQLNLPAYTGRDLRDFAPLYQYVRRVWTVEDFHPDSKKPLIVNYQTIVFSKQKLETDLTSQAIELNHEGKYPDRVFLWHNNLEDNLRLWAAAALCPHPLSLCLNINSDRYFANSPFLNQTLSDLDSFTVRERVISRKNPSLKPKVLPKRSLSRAITNKVKQDLEITIYHTGYAATLGREWIENLSERKKAEQLESEAVDTEPEPEPEEIDSYGFKYKESTDDNSDWF